MKTKPSEPDFAQKSDLSDKYHDQLDRSSTRTTVPHRGGVCASAWKQVCPDPSSAAQHRKRARDTPPTRIEITAKHKSAHKHSVFLHAQKARGSAIVLIRLIYASNDLPMNSSRMELRAMVAHTEGASNNCPSAVDKRRCMHTSAAAIRNGRYDAIG